MRLEGLTWYEQQLMDLALEKGYRWSNWHTHLDRANTMEERYWVHVGINPAMACMLTLPQKQKLVRGLHEGLAYSEDDLYSRMFAELEKQIALYNVGKVISLIDATHDIDLRAINAASRVKKKIEQKYPGFKFGIGTQPIFGFQQPKLNPRHWEIFKFASRLPEVEYIGGLPEKDDFIDKMGFEQHLRKIIKLGIEFDKPVHIHLDQMNIPAENGTERLINLLEKEFGRLCLKNGQPLIYAVHVISPSCYGEVRFYKLLENLKKYHIAVICCPRAAITTKYLRSFEAPLHACIARIFDMLAMEIPVVFGTDNIADIFISSGDGNMAKEFQLIYENLRFGIMEILVKLGCDVPLNKDDMDQIKEFLLLQKA